MKSSHSTKLIVSVFGILFGIFMFIYGGYDDSPGAQFIGLILFISGIVSIVKNRKNLK
jgi:uncharacterized membrane protein HdeD (DUF308 family)